MKKEEKSKSKNPGQSLCDLMMDRFLMLDKHERIPLRVTLHLLGCKKCRSQVRYLAKAEKIAAEPLKISVPLTNSKIDAILKEANPAWPAKNLKIKPVSMKKWIFYGILMILLMTTYQLSAAKLGSETVNTFFYIIFGIVVTAYCAIFIAVNLDFFVKKISSTNSQDLSACRS